MEFLAINTAKPFLSNFSDYITTKFQIEKWKKGYCPICGDSPSMAKLSKPKGKRSLYCSRCETEWPYSRLGCPYCGNKDADKISFLTADGYKEYRLYVCEKCKKYIKTVDERECGEVDLFCEDLKTTDYDKLAIINGYTKDTNSQKQ
jgi:FdhE protein